jgi:hypothetical protein
MEVLVIALKLRGEYYNGVLSPRIFFLIVGEVLIQLIIKAISEGRLKGITLPRGNKQQNIS